MKEYVTVPRQLLADRRALVTWLESSLEYALSLPPRVVKKKTKKIATKRKTTKKKGQDKGR